ncbi:Peroxisomal membrane protein PMP27 [Tulasnella sp. 418]|nr:Peroxisomal membrane protein PMP27 [Tulasnella sp. 418]
MENLQAALKASQSPAMKTLPFEQYATIGRHIGYAGYLSLDAIVWLNSVKFLRLPADRANRVNIASQRFWLAGIAYSIVVSLLKLNRLNQQAKAIKSSGIKEKDSTIGSVGEEAEKKIKLKTIAIERSATRYQLILDALDLWLPASNLGYVYINDGVAGIIGVITSVMAFKTQWDVIGHSK